MTHLRDVPCGPTLRSDSARGESHYPSPGTSPWRPETPRALVCASTFSRAVQPYRLCSAAFPAATRRAPGGETRGPSRPTSPLTRAGRFPLPSALEPRNSQGLVRARRVGNLNVFPSRAALPSLQRSPPLRAWRLSGEPRGLPRLNDPPHAGGAAPRHSGRGDLSLRRRAVAVGRRPGPAPPQRRAAGRCGSARSSARRQTPAPACSAVAR